MTLGALRDTLLPKRICSEPGGQDAKRLVVDATA